MRDEIVRLAKQLIDYSLNPDVRREIQGALAASLGAPVEIPKPETVGRYFVREAGGERFDVVEIFEAFEELHVSYFMQDRATTLDDSRFSGARWWTCPKPRDFEADGGDDAKG